MGKDPKMAQETTAGGTAESKDPGTTGFDTASMTDQERDEAASKLVDRFSLWSGAAGSAPDVTPPVGDLRSSIFRQ